MANWYSVSCEECGAEIRVCEDWSHTPRFCRSCKEERAAQWYERSCRHCGGAIRVHRDWDRVPDYHPDCAWETVSCAICGRDLQVHRSWENPPRVHKECRTAEASKRREKPCVVCRAPLSYRTDWEREPIAHKECWSQIVPKDISCSECGKSFRVGTKFQLRCRENGWELPTRCSECKHDALLIKGAVGALRDQVNFPLETTIEQRGLIFTDKVAVVRNRRTGEVVAEVTMKEKGILSVERIAVTIDKRDGENREIARTRDGSRGIIAPERTADTYSSESRERTHRTREVERGIIFRDRFAETQRQSGDREPVETRARTKGVLFPKRSIVSDRR